MKAINLLKKNKAPGLDSITNELIFAGKQSLVKPLCKLFNLIFRTAKYPQKWTLSFLKPIHKKDTLDDPDNYRGIAISLLNRLTEEANKRQLIFVNQIGFQKGKRTTDHIFVLQTFIDKIVKHEKQKLFVAFIDFRKAYNSISRNDLFFKLKQMEIRRLFLDHLKSLYSSIKYCVKIGNGYVDPIRSFLGLKQGCVLSPILFNLLIDDIKEVFNRQCDPVLLFDTFMNHLLYADDLIMMSNSVEGLQGTC